MERLKDALLRDIILDIVCFFIGNDRKDVPGFKGRGVKNLTSFTAIRSALTDNAKRSSLLSYFLKDGSSEANAIANKIIYHFAEDYSLEENAA